MEEKFLIFICLLTSLLGLVLIYIASITLKPTEFQLSQIDARLIGKTVTTSGRIVYKRYSKDGHLFLTISDNKTQIQVPLFHSFLESLAKVLDLKELRVGRAISITGRVDEYAGELQIVPRKPEDLKLIR